MARTLRLSRGMRHGLRLARQVRVSRWADFQDLDRSAAEFAALLFREKFALDDLPTILGYAARALYLAWVDAGKDSQHAREAALVWSARVTEKGAQPALDEERKQ
jgi:hypothetical protein